MKCFNDHFTYPGSMFHVCCYITSKMIISLISSTSPAAVASCVVQSTESKHLSKACALGRHRCCCCPSLAAELQCESLKLGRWEILHLVQSLHKFREFCLHLRMKQSLFIYSTAFILDRVKNKSWLGEKLNFVHHFTYYRYAQPLWNYART